MYSSTGDAVTQLLLPLDARSARIIDLNPLTPYRVLLSLVLPNGKNVSSILSPLFYTQPISTYRAMASAVVRFRMALPFDNKIMHSPAFEELAESIEGNVKHIWKNLPGVQKFIVLAFAPGSIVVTGNVTTVSGPPLDFVIDIFQSSINAGSIGNISVVVRFCNVIMNR